MTGPSEDRLALASAEDRHSAAEWEKITAAVLRKSGRMTDEDPDSAVWEKLARTTLDGISVAPIGTPDSLDGVVTTGRPSREGAWDIRAQVEGPDPKAANAAVLADLTNGVTSVWVQLGAGLTAADLAAVLDGVHLEMAPVVLSAAGEPLAAAQALVGLAGDAGLHADSNLGADPVGDAVRAGISTGSVREGQDTATTEVATQDLVAVARLAAEAGVRGVVVDATAVHDLGASDGQELGYALATGATYLRALVEAGFTVEQAAGLVELRLAATDEQFPTIAKFRAARRLWARVLELSGVPTDPTGGTVRIHGVTSRPMMGKYDPWVNMLRTTIGAFAAGVGGAEAVTVLPFDSTLGIPDAFGRRIARNTSSLLIHESHVAKVVDPAGGSYAVERLTDDLAQVAWAELGRIEEAGGVVAGLAGLRARIDEVVAAREQQIARRKRPLTGISEFPHLGEVLPERQPSPNAEQVRRYGASFEALRDEPAARPVFLATMGPIAHHTARATFVSNLFAAGGIAVETAGATDGVDALVAAYRASGTGPVVCLAGTDKAYAEWGADAVAALREAGASYVVLAGKPGEATVAADLVDDSAATGLDALAFLTRTRAQIEGALA